MITAPPKTTEWKIDRTPRGGVLKRVKNGKIEPKGHVIYSEQFGVFVASNPHHRVEVDDLDLALDILWSWRTGYVSDHHALCECDDCESRKHRRFGDQDEDDDL